MNMAEFQQVKNMTYEQYCEYLQRKYGIGVADYMTKSFNANPKCKRTNEGLVAHHKAEDKMIKLSTKEVAQNYPFEWQQKENIVYCDYLEHLLLHVLICKYPSPDKVVGADVGIGGVVAFIVPELNDLYSGWTTNQEWRKKCHDKVIQDKDVYMEIIKIFLLYLKTERISDVNVLYTSLNAPFGLWNIEENRDLFVEFNSLWCEMQYQQADVQPMCSSYTNAQQTSQLIVGYQADSQNGFQNNAQPNGNKQTVQNQEPDQIDGIEPWNGRRMALFSAIIFLVFAIFTPKIPVLCLINIILFIISIVKAIF